MTRLKFFGYQTSKEPAFYICMPDTYVACMPDIYVVPMRP